MTVGEQPVPTPSSGPALTTSSGPAPAASSGPAQAHPTDGRDHSTGTVGERVLGKPGRGGRVLRERELRARATGGAAGAAQAAGLAAVARRSRAVLAAVTPRRIPRSRAGSTCDCSCRSSSRGRSSRSWRCSHPWFGSGSGPRVRPGCGRDAAPWARSRRPGVGLLTLTLVALCLGLLASAGHRTLRTVRPIEDLAHQRAIVTVHAQVAAEPRTVLGGIREEDGGAAEPMVIVRLDVSEVTARGRATRVSSPVLVVRHGGVGRA